MASPANINKEDAAILAEMPDDERIREEYRRLKKLYSKIKGNKLKLVLKLISRAAFMAVTLADLEVYIAANGVTEEYQNGATQKGKKKSSEVEVYNAMVKNYASVIKELSGLLPQPVSGEKGDGFDAFVNGRADI